jgi:Flp pilus assembly protein TadD
VKLNPSVAGPRVLLGKLLVKRGEPDRAARQFEEALRLKPDDHTAAYPLAMIYRRAGNLKRAEELMAIAAKATSAADPSTPGAGSAAREDLVRIIREASK